MPQLGDVFHIVARGVQEAVCVIPFIVVVSIPPPPASSLASLCAF